MPLLATVLVRGQGPGPSLKMSNPPTQVSWQVAVATDAHSQGRPEGPVWALHPSWSEVRARLSQGQELNTSSPHPLILSWLLRAHWAEIPLAKVALGPQRRWDVLRQYLRVTITVKINKIALRVVCVYNDFNPPAHLMEEVLWQPLFHRWGN